MKREIVLDVETTGLRAKGADRIIELACLELVNHIPTGNTYHFYINPERDVPPEATKVHGITTDFLKDKPLFKHVVDGFLKFVGQDIMVIHNATFDIGFLNAELSRLSLPNFAMDQTIDTLRIARSKFPGSPATLDALCKRFEIDLSKRTFHGALLDCELLAVVYLELLGGRQKILDFSEEDQNVISIESILKSRPYKEPRTFGATDAEREAHEVFIKSLKNSIWG
jgi:DNA polymerase-3 subunit epsilon